MKLLNNITYTHIIEIVILRYKPALDKVIKITDSGARMPDVKFCLSYKLCNLSQVAHPLSMPTFPFL